MSWPWRCAHSAFFLLDLTTAIPNPTPMSHPQCRTLTRIGWQCALQLAQVRVSCDAGADDDGGRDAELLAREIDRLDGLDALQLVDGQGVAVDAVAAAVESIDLSGKKLNVGAQCRQ